MHQLSPAIVKKISWPLWCGMTLPLTVMGLPAYLVFMLFAPPLWLLLPVLLFFLWTLWRLHFAYFRHPRWPTHEMSALRLGLLAGGIICLACVGLCALSSFKFGLAQVLFLAWLSAAPLAYAYLLLQPPAHSLSE